MKPTLGNVSEEFSAIVFFEATENGPDLFR
jgi:hypothetical protein